MRTAASASSPETSSAAAAQPQTVVTLTFDDGWADVYQGLAMLNAHNMHATYFLNSPRISGDSAYMTWSNVADLAAAGNEIGGHTAYHADLPFIDPTEAQRQICYDHPQPAAARLQRHQFRVSVRRLQPGGEVDGAELRLQLRPHH